MIDAARRFECHMPGGPEVVDIVNVLVHEGSLCIVIQSARREEPYVLQVLPGGVRFATTDISGAVVDMHKAELTALAIEAAAAAKPSPSEAATSANAEAEKVPTPSG